MTIFGLVLAGGEGSRLGHVRKAELRLGNRTMLERVSAGLPREVIVSIGRGPGIAGVCCVPDLPGPSAGPIGGLAAAVRYLGGKAKPDDILISVAVDTPFLPQDYAARLIEALTQATAAFAAWDDQFYPTNAAYRFGAIADLPELVETFGSPKRLLAALGATSVPWTSAENPFLNLNTLADLVALARRDQ